MICPRVFRENIIQCVHGHLDGGVTDSVNTKLPAEIVALLDIGLNLLGREESPAAKSRLSFVVHQRPRGGAGEASVGSHFADGADAQKIVAVAGLLAEIL